MNLERKRWNPRFILLASAIQQEGKVNRTKTKAA
jgi:hypothetical protein